MENLRHSKSRVEEFHQRVKERVQAYVPVFCILGLAIFSVGVGKAYNWKIGILVLVILVTVFEIGYRRFQRVFNPGAEKKLR